MAGIHYYIIDTETTGLKAGFNEMTEIGIIRCSDRVQLHKKIRCEHPERANYDALKITGKTMADIVIGDSKEAAVAASEKFMMEDGQEPVARCIIAHNATFDRRFLQALWESVGKEFPAALWLDTIGLFNEHIKKADTSQMNFEKTATGRISTKLHACCDALGVKKLSAAHNAKVDSRNTYLLWMKLQELQVDHLPLIKTDIHSIKKDEELDFNFDDVEAP